MNSVFMQHPAELAKADIIVMQRPMLLTLPGNPEQDYWGSKSIPFTRYLLALHESSIEMPDHNGTIQKTYSFEVTLWPRNAKFEWLQEEEISPRLARLQRRRHLVCKLPRQQFEANIAFIADVWNNHLAKFFNYRQWLWGEEALEREKVLNDARMKQAMADADYYDNILDCWDDDVLYGN